MSNETKQDVFEDAVDALADAQASGGNVGHQDANLFVAEYENALPDDLPVIPKEVGKYIKSNRTEPLGKVFWHLGCISAAFLGSTRSYIVDHSEVFAYAWLLGVWRVEETGEIVKLEEL
ncbi:hypothetical protein [Limosilactobacillus fermentum]|uniref:hypothetical protein n=1 Tax=Limosilactobacillus fermentum TaxID=1613 RepID=UPI003B9834A3